MRDERTPKDVCGEATQTLYGSALGFEFYIGECIKINKIRSKLHFFLNSQ